MDGTRSALPESSESLQAISDESHARQPRLDNEQTVWSHDMEEAMLHGLVKAKKRGLYTNGTFEEAGWIRAAYQAERMASDQQITIEICKDRWREFQHTWKLFLRHQSEVPSWFWNRRRQGPYADPEEMDAYFDSHPEMEVFREKGPDHQRLLQPLLGQNTSLGRYAMGVHEAIRSRQEEKQWSLKSKFYDKL